MNEDDYRLRLIAALEYLIEAADRYTEDGLLMARAQGEDGRHWQNLVRALPSLPPGDAIAPPARVRFSLN